MNRDQLAVTLDYLASAFAVKVEPAQFEVWWDSVQAIDGEVALDAAKMLVENETQRGFPLMGTFKTYVGHVLRDRQRNQIAISPLGPQSDCGLCSGYGWYESSPIEHIDEVTGEVRRDEQFKPCPHCAPLEHDRWEHYKQERLRSKPPKPRDLLEREPSVVFSEARDALANSEAEA